MVKKFTSGTKVIAIVGRKMIKRARVAAKLVVATQAKTKKWKATSAVASRQPRRKMMMKKIAKMIYPCRGTPVQNL